MALQLAKSLESIYGVSALDAYGEFSRSEIAAAGGLVDYVALTQKGRLPRIAPPVRYTAGTIMEIDAATRRNLELMRTLGGEVEGSLLNIIDKTVTGAGARALSLWLSQPLTDPTNIAKRLDAVQFFFEDGHVRADLRGLLETVPDLARSLSRSLLVGAALVILSPCEKDLRTPGLFLNELAMVLVWKFQRSWLQLKRVLLVTRPL